MTGKAGAPLTEAMFYVLMALRRGELCGTEIAAWTERCTEERVRLGPGTLYTILGRFLEEGFIQETSVQGRQRNYRLTEKGQRAYRNERLRLRLGGCRGETMTGKLNEPHGAEHRSAPCGFQLCSVSAKPCAKRRAA